MWIYEYVNVVRYKILSNFMVGELIKNICSNKIKDVILYYLSFGDVLIATIAYNTMLSQKDSLTTPTSKTTQSEFYLEGKRCNLTSSCSVNVRPALLAQSDQFINYPCEVFGNLLRKSFKITINDHVITVVDNIAIDCEPKTKENQISTNVKKTEKQSYSDSLSQKTQNKKLVLFKNNSYSSPEMRGKNDKKNIVKNVVSAFMKYLKELKRDGAQIQSQVDYINRLIALKKFNNQLITTIVEQQPLRYYFKHFLFGAAPQWVQDSKIKCKQVYQEAIRLYQKLCDQKQGEILQQNQTGCSPGDKNSCNSICFQQLQNYELEEEIKGFK